MHALRSVDVERCLACVLDGYMYLGSSTDNTKDSFLSERAPANRMLVRAHAAMVSAAAAQSFPVGRPDEVVWLWRSKQYLRLSL